MSLSLTCRSMAMARASTMVSDVSGKERTNSGPVLESTDEHSRTSGHISQETFVNAAIY